MEGNDCIDCPAFDLAFNPQIATTRFADVAEQLQAALYSAWRHATRLDGRGVSDEDTFAMSLAVSRGVFGPGRYFFATERLVMTCGEPVPNTASQYLAEISERKVAPAASAWDIHVEAFSLDLREHNLSSAA